MFYRRSCGSNQPVHESEEAVVQAPGRAPYLVNLYSRTCSCTQFQQNGIPCTHAMAFLHQKGIRPENFLPPVFSIQNLHDSYWINIRPAVIQDLEVAAQIEPPRLKQTTDRKKKNRAEAGDRSASTKRQRRTDIIPAGPAGEADRPVHYCGRCGKPGHNRRTCHEGDDEMA